MSDNYHLPFGLTDNTKQYEYQNGQQFLSLVDQEISAFLADPTSRSEYVIFTGVSEETFRGDFDGPDSQLDFETYSIPHQLILVKMESHTHAIAHGGFSNLLVRKLGDMKIPQLDILPFGRAHVQGDDRIKRADEIYRPRRLPRHRTKHWPSLVVEVGYSEEVQRKLESDVNWWITQSAGDVKSAITIAINPRVKQVTICQWVGGTDSPQRVYRNVLSQDGGRPVKTTDLNPLVIAFEHLFLRTPLDSEQDITFPIDKLKEFAEIVWEVEFEA